MSSDELAGVAAFDAQGRHAEAIAALAKAAGTGDLTAMAALGRRLLVGDRGPSNPVEGARLLLEAARRGQFDAQERAAALLAGGLLVPQNWQAALKMLGLSAASGNLSARMQLRALRGEAGPSGNWERLASQFDLADWLREPSSVCIHEDPRIVRFPELLPDSVCEWLIEQSRGRLLRARVYDPIVRRETVDAMRSNTQATFGVSAVSALHFLVQARLAKGCRVPLTHFEAPAVLHYEVGEQITPHFDFIDPRVADYEKQVATQGQRIYTFLVYLNDAYESGETGFPQLGIEHRGSRREGLCFTNIDARGNPDLRMLHTGKPPTSGEKWIFSQFIRVRPVR
ncbi:MAG TPA: 2OG-Fe(II) oxygenase [Steroidobacteraceae bacterium]|jgi:prolyl 4-hydroxylase|nr:2OG-Fe(II) oxygenase [Steroidobacteraceae bacterium]